jgi:hypothetical protein
MPISRTALLVGIGVVVLAGAAATVFALLGRDPEGLVPEPRVLDFGTVLQGQRRTRTLRITNRTAGPMTIGLVGGNCACIQVRTGYAGRLAPGESTEVTVDVLATAKYLGTLHGKAVRVPHEPGGLLEVPLKVVVEEPVRVKPASLDLGTVAAGTTDPAPSRSVEVRPAKGVRARVLRADVTPADVFEARRVEVEGGMDVAVAVRPGAKGTGTVSGLLKVEVELSGDGFDTRREEVSVPVTLAWK